MPWQVNIFLLGTFVIFVTTVVAGESSSDDSRFSSVGKEWKHDCADFNNTTWREFQQQRTKLQVQYLLLTRRNVDCAAMFSQDSLTNPQQPSLFDFSLPTKIIVHGYRALGSKPSWVKELAQALLRAEDVNVVVVDWIYGASFAYNLVVENYKEVAVQISILINHLQNHGCKLESFHFIGVSLGAHVSGFVGTLFEGKIGRITGLDPAGPMFRGADKFDRLDPSDAQFVEAIHTDSDLYGYVICDHMRALHAYVSALNGSCPLTGIPCSSYEHFLAGRCLGCKGVLNGTCPTIGLSENSGITVSPIPEEQKVFLLTTSAPPYCAHHILLDLEVWPLDKSAEVEVTLKSKSLGTENRLRLSTDTTAYRRVLAHPVALCEINSIQLRNTGARFYRQAEIHVLSVCISEFPPIRQEKSLCVENLYVRRGTPWSHDFVLLCGSF